MNEKLKVNLQVGDEEFDIVIDYGYPIEIKSIKIIIPEIPSVFSDRSSYFVNGFISGLFRSLSEHQIKKW
jgi:hypothetical protein